MCKQAGKYNTQSKKGKRIIKKYTVIVDEDYQAFNENCNITLDEIDLKIQALNKELEDIKNIALKNYDILDKLFELRHVDF